MFFFLICLGLLAALIWVVHLGSTRGVPELGSASWMTVQVGLPAHLADDDALARYARRTRRWRVGGIVGAFAGSIVWGILQLSDERTSVNVFVALFIGWFGAGVVPELFVRNRAPTEHRAATLSPRAPTRYLTPTARRWLVASYVGILAALVAISLVAERSTPTQKDIVMILSASAVLAAIAALAVRRIATRHQPATSPGDVAIDEAIRSLATTRVVSGWTALNFLAVTYLSPAGVFSRANWIVSTAFFAVGTIGALGAWAWVPTRIQRRSAERPQTRASE